MKRILSVALGRHLLVIAGLALASTVGNLSAADTYYVSDHLATTTAVADAAGEIASLEADAFGSPVNGGEQAARYTGKPYDADIGAYVFPFRNYRSDEARWMSADSSGFPDGSNNQIYAPLPTSEIDPYGLATITQIKTTYIRWSVVMTYASQKGQTTPTATASTQAIAPVVSASSAGSWGTTLPASAALTVAQTSSSTNVADPGQGWTIQSTTLTTNVIIDQGARPGSFGPDLNSKLTYPSYLMKQKYTQTITWTE